MRIRKSQTLSYSNNIIIEFLLIAGTSVRNEWPYFVFEKNEMKSKSGMRQFYFWIFHFLISWFINEQSISILNSEASQFIHPRLSSRKLDKTSAIRNIKIYIRISNVFVICYPSAWDTPEYHTHVIMPIFIARWLCKQHFLSFSFLLSLRVASCFTVFHFGLFIWMFLFSFRVAFCSLKSVLYFLRI